MWDLEIQFRIQLDSKQSMDIHPSYVGISIFEQ